MTKESYEKVRRKADEHVQLSRTIHRVLGMMPKVKAVSNQKLLLASNNERLGISHHQSDTDYYEYLGLECNGLEIYQAFAKAGDPLSKRVMEHISELNESEREPVLTAVRCGGQKGFEAYGLATRTMTEEIYNKTLNGDLPFASWVGDKFYLPLQGTLKVGNTRVYLMGDLFGSKK